MKRFYVRTDKFEKEFVVMNDAIDSYIIAEVIFSMLTGNTPDWHVTNDGGNLQLEVDRLYDPELEELLVLTLADDDTYVTVAELEVLDE